MSPIAPHEKPLSYLKETEARVEALETLVRALLHENKESKNLLKCIGGSVAMDEKIMRSPGVKIDPRYLREWRANVGYLIQSAGLASVPAESEDDEQ